MEARRTELECFYNGKNITEDISKDLLSFSYTDNASGVADDISISLEDIEKKWLINWIVEQGDTVQAKIKPKNWTKEGDNQELDTGIFIVDEPEHSGRPGVFTLKGISIPSNLNFKDTPQSKIWKKAALQEIAQSIASNSGIELVYDCSINPVIKVKEQSEQPDMEFLLNLCKDNGLVMKIYNKKLVIFSEQEYEAKESILTVTEEMLTSWNLKKTLTQTGFTGCKIKYKQKDGKLIDFEFCPHGNDKVFQINEKAEDLAEAERRCKAKLRELNKNQKTAQFDFKGTVKLLASQTITVQGLGQFDGKYYIDKATHEKQSAYTTSIEVHKCLNGY